ncbi:hypothetical protein [Deinococcus sp.]|uniref:hypothetical protein n=1 Tax=Deinococcus sp. TaxID=47478 RepID=UPI003C79F81C
MGLAERRAVKHFQDELLPELQRRINEAAGFEVPTEIDWDSLSNGSLAPEYYAETWRQIYFEPLIAGLRDIARDELGQETLRQHLKRIVIQNSDQSYSGSSWSSFDGGTGTLRLDHQLANVGDVAARTEGLIDTLEKSL